MRDVGIADRLRAAGLSVVEVDGWRERGHDTLPDALWRSMGYVQHHTAGGRSGNAPSLAICINGRADLPGPLCNVFQARNNDVYVIAAGKANHAGPGGWNGLAGNSSVYGIEVENVGTAAEPWRDDQLQATALVGAALLNRDVSRVRFCCEHKEWSTQGKVDRHTITGDEGRRLISVAMGGREWDEMATRAEVKAAVAEALEAVWLHQANQKLDWLLGDVAFLVAEEQRDGDGAVDVDRLAERIVAALPKQDADAFLDAMKQRLES